MTQITLSKMQRTCLKLFDVVTGTQHTITVAKLLHVERAIAKNICVQLLKLGLLKHKDDFSYSITEAGKSHLQLITDPEVGALEERIKKVLADIDSNDGNRIFTGAAVARQLGMESEKRVLLSFMRDMAKQELIQYYPSNGCFALISARNYQRKSKNNAQVPEKVSDNAQQCAPQQSVVDAALDTMLDVVDGALDQLQKDYQNQPVCTDNKMLPPELEASLQNLQAKITFPPRINIQQLDLKLQVLDRLSVLMEDSIAEVLKQISLDLTEITNFGVTP